ncbi:MAG: DUF4097 family beta strand repeat-containing protein, partial [Nocardioidaceae bacterium]
AVWSFGDRDTDETHEVQDRISVVKLDTDEGNVTIEAAEVEQTTVHEKRSFWLIKRGDAFKVEGDTLVLNGDCGWNCDADFVVKVPRDTKVLGDLGSGDVVLSGVAGVDTSSQSADLKVRDVTGPVRIETTSGNVELDRIKGTLDVEVNSGDVTGRHLSGGSVRLKATSGDLKLDLDEPNPVSAEATSGEIDVTVPDDSYEVTADTSSGDKDIKVPSVTDGTHRIDAHTTSGDIALKTG